MPTASQPQSAAGEGTLLLASSPQPWVVTATKPRVTSALLAEGRSTPSVALLRRFLVAATTKWQAMGLWWPVANKTPPRGCTLSPGRALSTLSTAPPAPSSAAAARTERPLVEPRCSAARKTLPLAFTASLAEAIATSCSPMERSPAFCCFTPRTLSLSSPLPLTLLFVLLPSPPPPQSFLSPSAFLSPSSPSPLSCLPPPPFSPGRSSAPSRWQPSAGARRTPRLQSVRSSLPDAPTRPPRTPQL
mmetsp:Transcript_28340/g.80006  ORF Transcript_28340/g.80006 Transcript_28340/m.80006 type:complete len:246 (+) Transcript_28340:792-1529(+)